MIQPTHSPFSSFKTLYQYRDLLLMWTKRTIQARYQQSILGILWAIAQPAASVLIFTIIFTSFVPINTGGPSYAVFSFTAMVPWTFFAMSLTDMVNSLVLNLNLVTKIYFPREILPLAALCARLIDFVIAFIMLVLLMLLFDTPFFPAGWLYLPLIVGIQLMLTIGLGFMGAAINVFYRDIKHLFELVIRLWLYASPIIYPITVIPESYHTLYFLNPMAGIITSYRAILLYEELPSPYLYTSALISFVILLVGYLLFKRVEPHFADKM